MSFILESSWDPPYIMHLRLAMSFWAVVDLWWSPINPKGPFGPLVSSKGTADGSQQGFWGSAAVGLMVSCRTTYHTILGVVQSYQLEILNALLLLLLALRKWESTLGPTWVIGTKLLKQLGDPPPEGRVT